MSNWNLDNFDNLHSSLAESAYNSRPNSFPELFETDSVTEVKFSQPSEDNKGQITQGGTNLPNDGIVYLQPDKSLKSIDENVKVLIPDVNGGYHTEHYVTHSYQKGVLTDDKAGFNAYYLSDTEKIDSTTKHTYLAIRGSDGIGLDTLNDWVSNNAMFAVSNKYIPQAKLANKAMKEKIAELKGKAPGAIMDVTGHSLGFSSSC